MLLLNGLLHIVIHLNAVGSDNRNLAVFHIGDVACMLYYCRNIGGNKVAALTVAYEQGCVLACRNESVGAVGADDAERIRALKAVKCLKHGVKNIATLVVIVGKELGNDLGIGLGAEFIAATFEKIAQLDIVFDYTVVNDRHLTVTAQMRMGIYIVRLTVSCPTGVAYAECTLDALAALNYIA